MSNPRSPVRISAAHHLSSLSQQPEFQDWIADSQVRDALGDPLVLFHGTQAQLDRFDTAYLGTGCNDNDPGECDGFYWTTNLKLARRYAGGSGRVIAAVLRVVAPYRVSAMEWALGEGLSPAEAFDAGYDGYAIAGQEGGDTWLVPNANAIYTLDGNPKPWAAARPDGELSAYSAGMMSPH